MASLARRIARHMPLVGAQAAVAEARRRFRDDAAAALRALPVGEAPLLLGYYPRFRTNPYQQLLYLAAADHGIAAVGMSRAEQIDALAGLQRAGTATVLHLHWLTPVLAGATDEADGAARIEAFVARLAAYRAGGGRIAWTVHNVLPHESRWESLEIRLCRAVAELADIIHVMAGSTAAAVAPYYELPPERILHVPHPSYAGVYPTDIDRADARRDLGLEDGAHAYLALGSIRTYKGLDLLLDAWRSLPADGRRLIVAGAPLDEPALHALLRELRATPGVSVDARRLEDADVARYLAAADVAVLPYRRALNSGALMLFLTAGLPVVVPAGTFEPEFVEPSFAVSFEPDDARALAAALERAPAVATPAGRTAAAATAGRYDPRALSGQFAAELRRRVEGG